MITITQPKIAGLIPRWAPFPGFSLLFDAPPGAYRRQSEIEILDCDVEADAHLDFFRRAQQGLQAIYPERLLRTYGFCPLPPASYHVTAFDVANVADLVRCHSAVREDLQATLDKIPSSAAFEAELLHTASTRNLVTEPLTFGYGELCHWGGVLVIRLAPRNDTAFDRFVAARAELSQTYRAQYGVGARERFTPHLSLGYFLNEETGELARARLDEWNERFARAFEDATLTFSSASLHGFTDMATFFRLSS